jgi:hypothetical protein
MEQTRALQQIFNKQLNFHQALVNFIYQQKNNHLEYDIAYQLSDIREQLIKVNQRAERSTTPDHLKTCDITKPFKIHNKATGNIAQFDIYEHPFL